MQISISKNVVVNHGSNVQIRVLMRGAVIDADVSLQLSVRVLIKNSNWSRCKLKKH
jgi:hypothetical protein